MGFLSRFFNKDNTVKQNKQLDTRDRYVVEHSFLPSCFFGEQVSSLIDGILKEPGKFFVKLYNVINQDKFHYRCPYSTEQFSTEKLILDGVNGINIIQIQMPKPEKTPLCEKIFLVYDDMFKMRRYITLEKDDVERLVICEWTESGEHMIYSKYSEKSLLKIFGAK